MFLVFDCNEVFCHFLPLTWSLPGACSGCDPWAEKHPWEKGRFMLAASWELVVKLSLGENCKDQGHPGGLYRGWDSWKCS